MVCFPAGPPGSTDCDHRLHRFSLQDAAGPVPRPPQPVHRSPIGRARGLGGPGARRHTGRCHRSGDHWQCAGSRGRAKHREANRPGSRHSRLDHRLRGQHDVRLRPEGHLTRGPGHPGGRGRDRPLRRGRVDVERPTSPSAPPQGGGTGRSRVRDRQPASGRSGGRLFRQAHGRMRGGPRGQSGDRPGEAGRLRPAQPDTCPGRGQLPDAGIGPRGGSVRR